MDYKITKRDPINVIGVKLHVMNPDEAPALIGQFWETFRKNDLKKEIPNKLKPENTYAVYTNYGPQGEGYSLILGAQVEYIVNNVPDGMVGIQIPEQTYAVFSKKGALPNVIVESWKEIWQSPIPRAYTYDFEIYKNESLDSAEVEFNIALRADYTQAG